MNKNIKTWTMIDPTTGEKVLCSINPDYEKLMKWAKDHESLFDEAARTLDMLAAFEILENHKEDEEENEQ